MNALGIVAVLFAVAVSACLSRDIIDMTLRKMCQECKAMTKSSLHKRKERIIKYLLIPYRMLRNSTG